LGEIRRSAEEHLIEGSKERIGNSKDTVGAERLIGNDARAGSMLTVKHAAPVVKDHALPVFFEPTLRYIPHDTVEMGFVQTSVVDLFVQQLLCV